MLLDELGARIRAQREKRGLKQQDVANALQVSHQAVSKWERGENAPDIAILGQLCLLLGVTTDWLLGVNAPGVDTFPATVLATTVNGAFRKSLDMAPRDFAAWANGFLLQITEAVLRHDGVPLKYMGDAFLGFFSGADHARRALEAARLSRSIVTEDLHIGLSAGDIYLGSVGHPDYARPDIMGQAVNLAFLVRDWVEGNAPGGIAATAAVIEALAEPVATGERHTVHFRGIPYPVQICEIKQKPLPRGGKG